MGVVTYHTKNSVPGQTFGFTEIVPSVTPQLILIIGHGIGERNTGDLAGCKKSSGWGGWYNIKAAADVYGVVQIYINTTHDYEFGEYEFALQWVRTKYGSSFYKRTWVLGHSLGSYGAGKYAFKSTDFCSKIAGWIISAPGNFLPFVNVGGDLFANLIAYHLRVWGVSAANDTVSGTSPTVVPTVYSNLVGSTEVIKTIFPATEWSNATAHNAVLGRITQRPMYYTGGNIKLITTGVGSGNIVMNLYQWMISNPRNAVYVDPTTAYGTTPPEENPEDPPPVEEPELPPAPAPVPTGPTPQVITVEGPVCISFSGTYIAHETETLPYMEVPIIMEGPYDGINILPENATFGGTDVECVDSEEVCCNAPTIIPFTNQLRSTIGYGPSLRAKHGSEPSIDVYYFDEETGEFLISVYTTIRFLGIPLSSIVVDHGGISSGFIKLV